MSDSLRDFYLPLKAVAFSPEGEARVRLEQIPETVRTSNCELAIQLSGSIGACVTGNHRLQLRVGDQQSPLIPLMGKTDGYRVNFGEIVYRFPLSVIPGTIEARIIKDTSPFVTGCDPYQTISFETMGMIVNLACQASVREYCMSEGGMTTDICFDYYRVDDSRRGRVKDLSQEEIATYCQRAGITNLEEATDPNKPARERDFCACYAASNVNPPLYDQLQALDPNYARAKDRDSGCLFAPCYQSSFRLLETHDCFSQDSLCVKDPVYRGDQLLTFTQAKDPLCSHLEPLPPPPPPPVPSPSPLPVPVPSPSPPPVPSVPPSSSTLPPVPTSDPSVVPTPSLSPPSSLLPASPPTAPAESAPPPEEKKRSYWWLWLLGIVLALIVIATIFLFLRSASKKKIPQGPSKNVIGGPQYRTILDHRAL